jgi:hypothetical protein
MKIKFLLWTLVLSLCGSAAMVYAQNGAPAVRNLYDIAYKGTPVVIDGNLDDWDDAHWIYLSQDHPNFVVIQGTPRDPDDFSGFFAMKMDDEAVYFAIVVRDEGTPMIETPATPNLAFNYDHLSVYLGLYDIGPNATGSPHIEGPGEFNHLNPAFADSAFEANRTYRIAPGLDDTETTLGPDFQMLIRAVEHDPATFDSEAFTYNGAYVDTTIRGTVAAAVLNDEENGYVLEWKVPWTSLAGQISKRQSPFRDFEWPLFQPEHDKIIVFDADITDLDEGDRGLNRFLRIGPNPALWRDSKSFGMRGRIVDLSQHPYDRPSEKLYIDYKPEQEITIDGNLSDWADSYFYGNNMDHPHFLQITNNQPVFGVPDNISDFAYYYSMKMDDDNLYVAIRVRDEGTPMIETPATPNLAFDYDHLSVYLGLYDIGNQAGSPHVEGPGEFNHLNPAFADSAFPANRTYRIGPGLDDTETTLGADYQLLIRAVEYMASNFDSEAHTYNGAYVDTTIRGTVAAAQLTADETGYILEWQIPWTSLAGQISKQQSPFRDFSWPLFEPAHGMVIAFDADVTDRDEGETAPDFLRMGRYPALWRDSKSFNMRGEIVQTAGMQVSINEPGRTERPQTIDLSQNYPNPFNPTTAISFSLPEAMDVNLAVYNLLGQQVAVVASGRYPAGISTVNFDAQRANLGSGVYIYRLTTAREAITRKMVLIK